MDLGLFRAPTPTQLYTETTSILELPLNVKNDTRKDEKGQEPIDVIHEEITQS